MRLSEKVAIVTGATKGIGEAIARRFAAEGACTVIAGRNVQRGEKVQEDIRASGGDALFVRTDLTVEADVRAMVEATVGAYGGVDILINNAAATDVESEGLDRPIAEQTGQDFNRLIGVGIFGLFYACKYTVPPMQQRGGGSIVNISAGSAEKGFRGMPTYSMTKGAMHALTRAIAADYGSDWIRANTVMVGVVPSSHLSHWIVAHPVAGPILSAEGTLPRAGHPNDVAGACLYLASDDSAWVTGIVLPVDGGQFINSKVPDLSEFAVEYASEFGSSSNVD